MKFKRKCEIYREMKLELRSCGQTIGGIVPQRMAPAELKPCNGNYLGFKKRTLMKENKRDERKGFACSTIQKKTSTSPL